MLDKLTQTSVSDTYSSRPLLMDHALGNAVLSCRFFSFASNHMRTIEGIANPIDHALPVRASLSRLPIANRIEARESVAAMPSTTLAAFGKATKVNVAIVAPVSRRQHR